MQVPGFGEFQHGPSPLPGYQTQVLEDSPLLYLRMGESSGPTAYDQAGQHHATEVGTLNWGLSGALSSDDNTAVGSSGTGGLRIDTTGWLPTGSSARTIELWFKPSESPNGLRGICYGMNPDRKLTLYYSDATVLVAVGPSAFGTITPSQAGTWHHVACVFPHPATNLNEFLIYLNGSQMTCQTIYGTGETAINTSDSPLYINTDEAGNYYNCDIDEVAVYAHALTSERVLSHYNAAIGEIALP